MGQPIAPLNTPFLVSERTKKAPTGEIVSSLSAGLHYNPEAKTTDRVFFSANRQANAEYNYPLYDEKVTNISIMWNNAKVHADQSQLAYPVIKLDANDFVSQPFPEGTKLTETVEFEPEEAYPFGSRKKDTFAVNTDLLDKNGKILAKFVRHIPSNQLTPEQLGQLKKAAGVQ